MSFDSWINLISLLVFTGLTIWGLWERSGKTRAQNVRDSIIVGVEAAARLPSVIKNSAIIKSTIQSAATAAGVEDDLHARVVALTQPSPPK